MRSQGGPVIEISGFATEISVTGMKIFPYEHSSPGNRDETFKTKWLRFRNIAAKMAHFLPCMYFHFRSRRISFSSKVTRVHKAATDANDRSLCSTILVVFLGCYPGRTGWNFPCEQTTKFVPVTELARLPGSYEEVFSKTWQIGLPHFRVKM